MAVAYTKAFVSLLNGHFGWSFCHTMYNVQASVMLQMLSYKYHIPTDYSILYPNVPLFVLLGAPYCEKLCHILYICNNVHAYSYGVTGCVQTKNVSRICYMKLSSLLVPHSLWLLMWPFRLQTSLYALLHIWHLYVFSPLWILPCITRLACFANRFPQTWHWRGFFLFLCTASCWRLWKHSPHSGHLYLSVWTFIWILRLCRDLQLFSHSVHEYCFFRVCDFTWTCINISVANFSSHTVQEYGCW